MTAGMVGKLGVVVGRCGKLQRNCLLLSLLSIFAAVTWAGTGGAISGTVKDSSGAVVAKVTVTAIHIGTGVRQEVTTDDRGVYSFPVLSVGHYDLEFNGAGFRPYRRTGITVDANSALRVDAVLQVGEKTD